MVGEALAAAEVLAESGIDVEVIDPRTLAPLDMGTIIASVKKTHRAVIVHEACTTCGIGAEIGMRIMEEAFDYLDAPVKRVAAVDVPVPYNRILEDAALPNVEDIIRGVREVLA
jgi:pyruvate dehydrogenase E1 component beta subunit